MSDNRNLPAQQKGQTEAPAFATEIEQAWQLYRDQLQRNFELMKIIGEQQRIIEQFVSNGVPQFQPLQKEDAQSKPQVQGPVVQIQSIPLKRSKQLEQVYRLLDKEIGRTDAIQNHLELLYAIHQLGETYPEKLFTLLAIPDSTGYRYTRHLINLRLIKSKSGKYHLSGAGTLLMQEPLDTPDHLNVLVEKLRAEKIDVFEHELKDTLWWFKKQDEKG